MKPDEKLALQQELYNLSAGTLQVTVRPQLKTIACVLNINPFQNRAHTVEYTPDHVRWLKRQVEKCCTVPHRFVCFSNVPIDGIEVIPLLHNWPGWWSKLEMFAELEEAFYLDLDTVLVGSIDELVMHRPDPIMVLRSLAKVTKERINSGIMAWNGDFRFLYRNFLKDADRHMAHYVTSRRWGDQGYIQDQLDAREVSHDLPRRWELLQDVFPNRVVSYKNDMECQGVPPAGASVVCFHGQPKPQQVMDLHSWIMR